MAEEYQIWSYDGCSNIHIALALNSFIKEHAPGTTVVVHRDRDYMTENEIEEYKSQLENVGIKVFITNGNDAESHFVNEFHINQLYPALTIERIAELINNCLTERREKIVEKYINTIHKRCLERSYRGGERPDAGRISTQCNRDFDGNMRDFMHGKIVERALRSKLQQETGQQVNLCRVTEAISDPVLRVVADDIWND